MESNIILKSGDWKYRTRCQGLVHSVYGNKPPRQCKVLGHYSTDVDDGVFCANHVSDPIDKIITDRRTGARYAYTKSPKGMTPFAFRAKDEDNLSFWSRWGIGLPIFGQGDQPYVPVQIGRID